MLAICSGALRKYLSRHGGVPAEPLIAGMPFSLRESGNTEYSTQATMTLVNLATDIADPVQRLRAIRDAAGAIKSVARRAKSVIPVDTPSLGAPWLLGGLAALYGRSRLADAVKPIMNVVISNVPGPTEPLYAAGARMRTYWPMSIVEHGDGAQHHRRQLLRSARFRAGCRARARCPTCASWRGRSKTRTPSCCA